MKKISKFILPENIDGLYKQEARSSIALAREVAEKINELVTAFNQFSTTDLAWKHEQEGRIRGGILYMKDNLMDSLQELLKLYDHDAIKGAIKGAMLEAYGEDLKQMKVIVTPQMFGAIGNGTINDRSAIEKAIASLKEGDILFFPKGTYLMTGRAVEIKTANVTFMGEGLILCDYGFRVKASNFKAIGLRMEATKYSTECRAFLMENRGLSSGDSDKFIRNFTFKDCYFKNFFYAVNAIGGSYNYGEGENDSIYPVRDIVVENCFSETYTDQNAGHFQCIQVENISYINNRTYGGKNASSYNAIKANGFIRVVGNYDHNNSYASCELENGTCNGVVASNTFKGKIWIDDCYRIVVNGNTTEDGISVTVGTGANGVDNIAITNNSCKNVRCEQFGTYKGGVVGNLIISNNSISGDNTHGIFVNGNAAKRVKISGNIISGINTNDISIQRNEQIESFIQGNIGNGKNLLIAGSGGKVFAIDNFNFNVSGNRDSLEASHLERSFTGIKITDSNNVAYRINVNSSGELYASKY